MNELLFVLASGVLTAITQFTKQYVPKVNPLFIAGILSLIVGGIWVTLTNFNGNILKELAKMWTTAVVIYNVFIETKKAMK